MCFRTRGRFNVETIDYLTCVLVLSIEAFVAALYVDKGLRHVEVFCRVCLFPRLEVKHFLVI